MHEQPDTYLRTVYEITVKGQLDDRWSDWFGGLTITHTSEDDGASLTRLIYLMDDQPTLRGILNKIWDLNLVLISVIRLEPGDD